MVYLMLYTCNSGEVLMAADYWDLWHKVSIVVIWHSDSPLIVLLHDLYDMFNSDKPLWLMAGFMLLTKGQLSH